MALNGLNSAVVAALRCCTYLLVRRPGQGAGAVRRGPFHGQIGGDGSPRVVCRTVALQSALLSRGVAGRRRAPALSGRFRPREHAKRRQRAPSIHNLTRHNAETAVLGVVDVWHGFAAS